MVSWYPEAGVKFLVRSDSDSEDEGQTAVLASLLKRVLELYGSGAALPRIG